jgi:hypothetical protein
MVKSGQTATPDGPRSPWLAFAKFLFLIISLVLLYRLLMSMVAHHFFSG